MRILVAEDDPESALTYKLILEGAAHEVYLARDGIECMSIYLEYTTGNQTFFDAVLLDYQMPNKDGLECTLEISSLNPNQKILMVTAYQRNKVQNQLRLPNMCVLEKPVGGQELLSAVAYPLE